MSCECLYQIAVFSDLLFLSFIINESACVKESSRNSTSNIKRIRANQLAIIAPENIKKPWLRLSDDFKGSKGYLIRVNDGFTKTLTKIIDYFIVEK